MEARPSGLEFWLNSCDLSTTAFVTCGHFLCIDCVTSFRLVLAFALLGVPAVRATSATSQTVILFASGLVCIRGKSSVRIRPANLTFIQQDLAKARVSSVVGTIMSRSFEEQCHACIGIWVPSYLSSKTNVRDLYFNSCSSSSPWPWSASLVSKFMV